MSNMRNSVSLMGRPGADPVIKNINSEQKMATFRLAVDDYKTNANGERVPNTQWFSIVAWGPLADSVMKLIHKGKKVMVSGSLHNNEWTDDKGLKHYNLEIFLNDFLVLEWPENNAAVQEQDLQSA